MLPLDGVGVVCDGDFGDQLRAAAALGSRGHLGDLDDAEGPDLAALLAERPLRSRRVRTATWTRQRGWAALIRRLSERLAAHGQPASMPKPTVACDIPQAGDATLGIMYF